MRAGLVALALLAACGPDATMSPYDSPSPDAPAFPRQSGLVSLTSNETSTQTTLSAGFYETSAAGEGCAVRAEGPCTVTICGDASGIMPLSAGDVTATSPGGMLLAQPGVDGQYSFPVAPMAQFPPGATITLAAAGADVPAFSRDVVVPAAVTVIEPPMTTTTLARSVPFTARWTPAEGNVYVYVANSAPGPALPIAIGGILRCVVPSSAGELTVSVSLLADLAPGAGTIAVTGIDEARLNLGEIEVQARALATRFALNVTFE